MARPVREVVVGSLFGLPTMAHWHSHLQTSINGSSHTRATRWLGYLFRNPFQLGFRNGGRHWSQRDLPHAGPIRLDRRTRHNGIHRSCGGHDRYSLHAAHDGFAGTAESIHRLLDTGLWSNGIDNRSQGKYPRRARFLRKVPSRTPILASISEPSSRCLQKRCVSHQVTRLRHRLHHPSRYTRRHSLL